MLAFESTRFNSTTLTNEPRTVWQFNNLDGTKFVDDRGWSTSDYAYAGQRHAASNTDYLVQSRDSARHTWSSESEHGSVGYAAVEAFFGSIGGSLSRFGNGLLQLGANAVDTAMIGLNAATTLGGLDWQYRALGATGQAVEANELTTSDIVYNVGAGLGTMALDTVSLGGYATYQYNVGLITAEEAGDRFIGLGLMALGGAGSLRAAGLTNMTVGQARKVVANAITHPVSTVKPLGGMMRSSVAPRNSISLTGEVNATGGLRIGIPEGAIWAPQKATGVTGWLRQKSLEFQAWRMGHKGTVTYTKANGYLHNGKWVELEPGLQIGDNIFISARAFDVRFMKRHMGMDSFGWKETLAHEIGHTKPIGSGVKFGAYADPKEFWASFRGSNLPGLSSVSRAVLRAHAERMRGF